MSEHPTPGELERFLQGELPSRDCIRVLRHLAAPCEECLVAVAVPLAIMAGVHELPRVADPETGAYDPAVDRASQAGLSWAQARPRRGRRAERLVEDVVAGRRGWADLTRNDLDQLDDLDWVEVWIRRSQAFRYLDMDRMKEAAEVACTVALGLDRNVYGPAKRHDTCALAWAELANAYRTADDLAAAERFLDDASDHLGRGSGDLGLAARVAEIAASLACDQRRFVMAHELVDLACHYYRQVGDLHMAGRALITKGHYASCEELPEEALPLMLQGFQLLDPARDPELTASVLQNTIHCAAAAGQHRDAQMLLWQARLHRLLPEDGINRIRLWRTEGTIWSGLGQLERAENAFREAKEGFESHGLWLQAALAGLELAKVWLRQGREQEVLPLAGELVETFCDMEIRREAVAALRVLERACLAERLTEEIVDRVAEYLRDLERNPAAVPPPLPRA